jgi:ubiquinone/menaquinone biosynthesis C-methylase UbiE
MYKKKVDSIKEAFNKASNAYASNYYYELYFKHLDVKLLDLFCERVNPNKPICEVGCGPGEISTYLKYKGLDLVGIDIAENMVEQAKKLNPNIDFRVGNVFSLEFPDNYFSGLLAPFLFVNYEVEEIMPALTEINRVLEPKGLFYLSFHEGSNRIHVDDFLAENNPLDFIYLNIDEMERVLIESGFEIIEWIVRSPYKTGEHANKRAYFFARAVK